MLTSSLIGGLRVARAHIIVTRNLAAATPSDPVQKLFLDKVREYKQKSSGGQLVEPSAEIQKELKSELEKLEKQYGGKGEDMTKFPSFNFGEPKLDPIDEQVDAKK